MRTAIAAILARPTTRVVQHQSDVAAAVRGLGVRPAARWRTPQPVFTQRRARGRTSYYYLWNASPRALSFTGDFDANGPPVQLDLWNGEEKPVPGRRVGDGRWSVPIHLAPRETSVLAFSPSNPSGAGPRLARADARPRSVGPWRLSVDSWEPGGRTQLPARRLTELRPWTRIHGLGHVSGVGTYRARVHVPRSWLGRGRAVELDVGRVHGAIQTYMNGQLATREIDPTAPIDVTPLLHAGANTLKVVLATTAMNRALVTRSTFVGRPRFATEAALGAQSYGLLGPVRLLPATAPGRRL